MGKVKVCYIMGAGGWAPPPPPHFNNWFNIPLDTVEVISDTGAGQGLKRSACEVHAVIKKSFVSNTRIGTQRTMSCVQNISMMMMMKMMMMILISAARQWHNVDIRTAPEDNREWRSVSVVWRNVRYTRNVAVYWQGQIRLTNRFISRFNIGPIPRILHRPYTNGLGASSIPFVNKSNAG